VPSAPSTPSAPANINPPAIVGGTTTEGQTLTASPGTWTGSPTSYAYQWQDCNASGAECANIAGASALTRKLASSDVGHTLRMVVSAKNAAGSTSVASAATAKIAAKASSKPAALTDTKPPAIGGTTTEGQTLTASPGTWTGSPTSYAYQWQDCNASGAECANIAGASASTRKLVSVDVGQKVRVVVTAKNVSGSASADSAQVGPVTQPTAKEPPPKEEPPVEEPPSGGQAGCFSAPGACGYPDPSYGNVGPSSACSSLTSAGNVTANTAGATIQNMDIKGEVTVNAKNVTLTNDCISNEGGGTLGSRAVAIASGVTGTQITHSDVSGANSTSQSVEEALSNNYANANTTADHDYIFNCGECVHGAWTLTNSYVIVNGKVPNCGSECPDHYEDIYCDSSTFIAEHDVLLNPEGQTAALFCDTGGGSGGPAENHITLTNSLVAGGGYSLYPQGNSSSVGSSTMDIANNRFARCLTTPVHESGTECKGGADLNGYWPLSGYYGVTDSAATYCPPTSGQAWSNNVWDDDSESIGCE
jgi:hypothetical protein